ncbi:MAG: hypothetical protein GTO60_17470, partial [Gammaproteobacteria bacterium]|nr:hypothetical protein [Gammaproteobacteria bacterium]
MGILGCALTINNAIVRAVFTADCDGFAPEVDIAIARATVSVISYNNYITIDSGINRGLNSLIIIGYAQ